MIIVEHVLQNRTNSETLRCTYWPNGTTQNGYKNWRKKKTKKQQSSLFKIWTDADVDYKKVYEDEVHHLPEL